MKTRKRMPERPPRRMVPAAGPRMMTEPLLPRAMTLPVSMTGRFSFLPRTRLLAIAASSAGDVEGDPDRRGLGGRIGNAGLERQPLAGLERAVVDLHALGAQHLLVLVEEQDAHRGDALRVRRLVQDLARDDENGNAALGFAPEAQALLRHAQAEAGRRFDVD